MGIDVKELLTLVKEGYTKTQMAMCLGTSILKVDKQLDLLSKQGYLSLHLTDKGENLVGTSGYNLTEFQQKVILFQKERELGILNGIDVNLYGHILYILSALGLVDEDTYELTPQGKEVYNDIKEMGQEVPQLSLSC